MSSGFSISGSGEIQCGGSAQGPLREPVALPGHLRELTFYGPYAVVRFSELGENRAVTGLPLHNRLVAAKIEPRRGIYVIGTRSVDIVHWIRIRGVVT